MLAKRFVWPTARYAFWCNVIGAFAVVVSFHCAFATNLWFSTTELLVPYSLASKALDRAYTRFE